MTGCMFNILTTTKPQKGKMMNCSNSPISNACRFRNCFFNFFISTVADIPNTKQKSNIAEPISFKMPVTSLLVLPAASLAAAAAAVVLLPSLMIVKLLNLPPVVSSRVACPLLVPCSGKLKVLFYNCYPACFLDARIPVSKDKREVSFGFSSCCVWYEQ